MNIGRNRTSGRALALMIAAIVGIALAGAGSAVGWWFAHRNGPLGLEKRIVWTENKVVGAPEAVEPYMTERVYPKLKFNRPVEIGYALGNKRVFVMEERGKLYSFPNDQNVSQADLMFDCNSIVGLKKIAYNIGVRGYGFAFDPQFQRTHYIYICYVVQFPEKRSAIEYEKSYSANATASRVSRFSVTQTDPPTIDPKSEVIVISWPGGGFNGGCVKFGQDGALYIGTGDGSDPTPPDVHNVGQNVEDLRSKILRLDVQNTSPDKPDRPYSIPVDNPFTNTANARPEIYAYGLRNPWRFTVDRLTGEVWCGDVGWELWESIHHIQSGGNYGWSKQEGPQPVHPTGTQGPTPILDPALVLPHTEAASIIGGYVYRGSRVPGLTNHYIFGDWETRRLWAAPCDGLKIEPYRMISQTDLRIVSFGEDADGELTILDHQGGGLHRIVPNPAVGTERTFPRKLSETGLFADVAAQKPRPGVYPFDPITPQYVDGSTSERFIGVPAADPVVDTVENDETVRVFPKDTVLVRTLSMPMTVGESSSRRRIETQLVHFDGRQWHGYAYKWNNEQNDAELVDDGGQDIRLDIKDPSYAGGHRKQTWHFHSRAQCMTCHTKWSGYALAFNELQLNHNATFNTSRGPLEDNALRSFRQIGLLPPPPLPDPKIDSSKPALALVDPYREDPNVSLDDRARSYLHVNCAVCHRFGGGGTAIIDLSRNKEFRDTKVVTNPMLGTFGLPDALVICPGDVGRSLLYYRMAKIGVGHMPHLGSTTVDDAGLDLMARWIISLRQVMVTPRSNPELKQEVAQQRAALRSLQQGASGGSALNAIDKLLSSPSGALKLLAALSEGRIPAGLKATVSQRAIASSEDSVREVFARFVPEMSGVQAKVGNSPDIDKLLSIPADADRGKKVFFEYNGGLCSHCHTVDGAGMDIGPDLSHIGAKYNKADILDNIIHPDKSIVPGYETWHVLTKSEPGRPGDHFFGFITRKTEKEITLKEMSGAIRHIPIADVDTDHLRQDSVSAMPTGILINLDLQRAADLLEFLSLHK